MNESQVQLSQSSFDMANNDTKIKIRIRLLELIFEFSGLFIFGILFWFWISNKMFTAGIFFPFLLTSFSQLICYLIIELRELNGSERLVKNIVEHGLLSSFYV